MWTNWLCTDIIILTVAIVPIYIDAQQLQIQLSFAIIDFRTILKCNSVQNDIRLLQILWYDLGLDTNRYGCDCRWLFAFLIAIVPLTPRFFRFSRQHYMWSYPYKCDHGLTKRQTSSIDSKSMLCVVQDRKFCESYWQLLSSKR